jgi:N-acetylglucosamine-6-phosphate deacetylase
VRATGTHLIAAGTVVAGDTVHRPGWVEVDGERIVGVGGGMPSLPPDTTFPDASVVPGFVDIHVHGGGGGSFTSGDPEQAVQAMRFHRGHGTTTMLASLVSAPPAELLRSVTALVDLVDDGVLAGIHLEGPYLSAAKCGAHDPAALRDPDADEIDRLLRAGRGTIRMVTLAPERPGGLAAVGQLADAGVTIAVGHTDADYQTTRDAIEAGARVATHLFNAMPPVHHRDPGPVLALLEDLRVVLELIADGTHLHPALVRHVLSAAGVGRVALVTDAMSAAGMADGSYQLGSLDVEVAEGTARLTDGTIAGSTTTTSALFATALQALAGSAEPLAGASVMTASTPATAVGLHEVGVLQPGNMADLAVLDAAGPVVAVMRHGRWVSPSDEAPRLKQLPATSGGGTEVGAGRSPGRESAP